jgi:hypothetical protein
MAEKHEKAASLMARAVLKLREQDKVDAVGAIEELLHDDDDAPQVNVEALVRGGSVHTALHQVPCIPCRCICVVTKTNLPNLVLSHPIDAVVARQR